MALLSLLFRAFGVSNRIGLVRLDATLQEIHDRSSRITDHPIEGGSTMQDHIVRMPRKLTMEGFITDDPLNAQSFGVQSSFELLDLTWKLGIPFFVVSGLRVYPLMAFESLTMPKTREGAMRFSASMKEITLTVSGSASVPGGKASGGAPQAGNVSNTPAQAGGTNAGVQPTASIPTSAATGKTPGGGGAGGGGSSSPSTGSTSGSLLSKVF